MKWKCRASKVVVANARLAKYDRYPIQGTYPLKVRGSSLVAEDKEEGSQVE